MSNLQNAPPENTYRSSRPSGITASTSAPYPKWVPPTLPGYPAHAYNVEESPTDDYAGDQHAEYDDDTQQDDGYDGEQGHDASPGWQQPITPKVVPPARDGPYPGQPGYKWQPPAVMKAFLQHTADVAAAPYVPPQTEHRPDSTLNSSSHSQSSRGSNTYRPGYSSGMGTATASPLGAPTPHWEGAVRGNDHMDSSRHTLSSRSSDLQHVPSHESDLNLSAPHPGQSGRKWAPSYAVSSAAAAASLDTPHSSLQHTDHTPIHVHGGQTQPLREGMNYTKLCTNVYSR